MDVVMPRLADSITEGTVIEWFVETGAEVREGDVLAEISSDKVDSELLSPAPGVIERLIVDAGTTVPVGAALAVVTPPLSESVSDSGAVDRASDTRPVDAAVDLAVGAPVAAEPSVESGERRGLTSPAVRRLAELHGIDLASVSGSGGGGRILTSDLQHVVARGADRGPARSTVSGIGRVGFPTADADPNRTVPLSASRRATARHLRHSVDTAVHAYVSTAVDYDEIDRIRRAAPEGGAPPTFLHAVARSVTSALADFELLNGWTDADGAVQVANAIDLGIAVDLDHRGLVVPVVRQAERLLLRALAVRIVELAARARAGELTTEDLHRPSFTISNVGRYATTVSVPVINHPQVAILVMDGIEPAPVAVDEGGGRYGLSVRLRGQLGLSFDHRVVDGAYAAAFLQHVRRGIEQPSWLHEI